MTDADLDLRLRQWLTADAAAIHVPDALHRRVLDIPASIAPAGAWWHRFTGLPMVSASLATAGVAGLLIATMFFGLFDRPAGSDGGTCSNRQVQQALDNLRDAPGYRFVNRDQTRQLDPGAQLDLGDPEYVWTDAWASEGAYLAPDRALDVPTFKRADGLYDRGYLEHLQIDGHTYRRSDADGWVEERNWPTANLAYGYIGAAFPTFSVPLVSGTDWGGTAVTPELPGSGGCTAATAIPLREEQTGVDPQRAVALRVDVRTLLPTAVAIGPAEGQRPREGEARSTWKLTWETPDASEFIAPTDAQPDPNTIEQSFVPTPSPSPLEPPANGWEPIELAGASSSTVTDVAASGERLVAVGATFPDSSAAMWTSQDGRSWDVVELDGTDGLGFDSVTWNGSIFLATGYRSHVPPEGEQFTSYRPETWLSDDGLTWRFGGPIGPAADTGEVANPGRPIFTDDGWIAGGAVIALETNQRRPAFFVSVDGAEWDTIELEGVGSGSLGSIVVLPDGSLFATGCESPGATNSGQFGEGCYQRPWRSDDGREWTAGALLDVEIGDMTRWGDRLVGVVHASDPTQQGALQAQLMTSLDGVTWEPLAPFPEGDASPSTVEVLGDELVVIGQRMGLGDMYPLGVVWRSPDGEAWESVPLAFPEGTAGTFIGGVVEAPGGLVIVGSAQLGETESASLVWVEPAAD